MKCFLELQTSNKYFVKFLIMWLTECFSCGLLLDFSSGPLSVTQDSSIQCCMATVLNMVYIFQQRVYSSIFHITATDLGGQRKSCTFLMQSFIFQIKNWLCFIKINKWRAWRQKSHDLRHSQHCVENWAYAIDPSGHKGFKPLQYDN